eukprot:2402365-Amphidinium_carterae.1
MVLQNVPRLAVGKRERAKIHAEPLKQAAHHTLFIGSYLESLPTSYNSFKSGGPIDIQQLRGEKVAD